MNIMIIAEQEHLRLGYKAVLEMKGHQVTDKDQDCVIVDVGDDLTEITRRYAISAHLNMILFIVSASYSGNIYQTADKVVVMRGPVTADALLQALNRK